MSAKETIPELLTAAADRDPEGTWLRTDEGTLTFAAAVGQVAQLAERLSQQGIGAGDLVVLPARTTPPFLLCWLALASLGALIAMAITAAINWRFQRDFAREWVESLRVKHKAPLGEDELARMARKQK